MAPEHEKTDFSDALTLREPCSRFANRENRAKSGIFTVSAFFIPAVKNTRICVVRRVAGPRVPDRATKVLFFEGARTCANLRASGPYLRIFACELRINDAQVAVILHVQAPWGLHVQDHSSPLGGDP